MQKERKKWVKSLDFDISFWNGKILQNQYFFELVDKIDARTICRGHKNMRQSFQSWFMHLSITQKKLEHCRYRIKKYTRVLQKGTEKKMYPA